MDDKYILEVKNLQKYFVLKQKFADSLAKKSKKLLKAVDNVSFTMKKGETLGLVGESGCGKSTLARTIVRLYEPDKGNILFEGKDISHLSGTDLRNQRKHIQMVFQDPYSSLNPRLMVKNMFEEILKVHKVCSKDQMKDKIISILDMVGMTKDALEKFPGEFSGGQRQRLGIARALCLNPSFIVADEPVSALDVSVQAQILNLLSDLKEKLNLTLLFISHDLRVVSYISDRVAVMYLGKMMELASSEDLFEKPLHPYTLVLTKAAPVIDPTVRSMTYAIEGDQPSPVNIPSGCRFHQRCVYSKDICKTEEPLFKEVEPNRFVACHFPLL